MTEKVEKTGKSLKVWAWIFIVISALIPLFGIGSIICSVKYKKYDQQAGSKLLSIAIIVMVVAFVYNAIRLMHN